MLWRFFYSCWHTEPSQTLLSFSLCVMDIVPNSVCTHSLMSAEDTKTHTSYTVMYKDSYYAALWLTQQYSICRHRIERGKWNC